jgi:hypothetical protein
MRWSAFTMAFVATLSFAASRCPDPNLRSATIGGHTIRGGVIMRKHLKSGRVVLYDALGKTAFVGLTDTNGVFAIND